jgi:DNA polymerase-3 subunit epsilon
MLHQLNLAIVDLETTGASAVYDRIIEVGIKRVERGQVVATYSQLVDPERPIPPIITQITGISDRDVDGAPTFAQIGAQVRQLLDGCIFVAHNVRFDYGFLRTELQRLAAPFTAQCLCTVRLSRLLYPHERQHSLGQIIERFNLTVAQRHRALDDAEAVWAFLQHAQQAVQPTEWTAALQALLRRPTLPPKLSPDALEALPDGPGAYVFLDAAGAALYVGKGQDIRDRVTDHFTGESTSTARIAAQIARIEAHPAYGDLGAALLAAHLTATRNPLLNRRGFGPQPLTAVCEAPARDGYATVRIEDLDRIEPAQIGNVLMVLPSWRRAKSILQELAEAHRLCPQLLGIERSRGACGAARRRRCAGACTGQEPALRYNARLAAAFSRRRLLSWPFGGPVVITEPGPEGCGHAVIVDQWRVVQATTFTGDGQRPLVPPQTRFDFDCYKLLSSHISRFPHTVRRLDRQTMAGLLDDPAAAADAWPLDEPADPTAAWS